ncbi:GlpG, membrane protein [Pyrenophora tritici-repentis]|uniref:GlpG, membrane protein n=1 Tax=Pyrenophora tritici-repentis TaxID=45151 RepID=A0A834VXU8_9PLEO|nr:GlpG, membrane protein [Pyrenophora tritici-repentis]
MFTFKIAGPSMRSVCRTSRMPAISALRPTLSQLRCFSHTRVQHDPQRRPRPPQYSQQQPEPPEPTIDEIRESFPQLHVYYIRPAIWAVAVSCGIFVGLSFWEAKKELKKESVSTGGWLQAPQWTKRRQGPSTPTEVVTGAWNSSDAISRLGYGIIGANTGVHLSKFLAPRAWDGLWHVPVLNLNYTQFTSMFVHSGALHFFFNMYFLNNFMTPVGYSQVFEGSPYHTLAFYLSTGVLSGYAQHLATLIPTQKGAIPEIFIKCGGASGALFGFLGIFCMQYPTAGLGIMFIPVHFEAQYVLPAILLFDFVGMVRGYTFVKFGHAAHFVGGLIGVAYSQLDGKTYLWRPLS